MTPAGTVARLWRYPVKSLGGEEPAELELDARGVAFDRLWALVDGDGQLASGKPSRRFKRVLDLMLHASRLDGDRPRITLADGRTAREGDPEMPALVEAMAGPGWSLRREAETPHLDAAPVHLATTATLAVLSEAVGTAVTAERLRPNVLVDVGGDAGLVEDGWVGRELEIGEVRLRVRERTERCVMVDQVRAGLPALPARSGVLKTAGRINDACAGVYADVVTPGRIRLGDTVRIP